MSFISNKWFWDKLPILINGASRCRPSVQGALVLLSDVWVTLFMPVLFRSSSRAVSCQDHPGGIRTTYWNDHTLRPMLLLPRSPETTSDITTKLKDASQTQPSFTILMPEPATQLQCWPLMFSKHMMLKIEPGSDFESLVWTHKLLSVVTMILWVLYCENRWGRRYK